MIKGNPHKKMTFEDRFLRDFVCSKENHPEGWAWWKKKNRKDFRRKWKKETKNEIEKS